MANKILTLTDFSEFEEAAERLSKLRLRRSDIDEKIKCLAAQINHLDTERENQDINTLANNPDIELSSYKRRDLVSQMDELKAESDALQGAISQVRGQVDGIKRRLLPQIGERFRPQHQKLVQDYIDTAKKIVAARQEILDFTQQVGTSTNLNPGDLIPIFHLRTLGTLEDSFSFLGLLADKARASGYEVR